MKILSRTLIVLTMTSLPILFATADTSGLAVDKELIVSGELQQVLEAENVATLKTAYGARIDVSLDALPPWDGTEQAGYQELEEGLVVTARMHPGVVNVIPSSNNRMWVTVDGDEFIRLHPRDLNEELFHDNERSRGDHEISLARQLKKEAHTNPLIDY